MAGQSGCQDLGHTARHGLCFQPLSAFAWASGCSYVRGRLAMYAAHKPLIARNPPKPTAKNDKGLGKMTPDTDGPRAEVKCD